MEPRTGGEKLGQTWGERGIQGSPPRRRGKGVRSGVHRCCRWITPAQAGKRTEGSRYTPESEDHPRTSGEKVAVGAVAVDDEGSPPRRRGKVFLTDLVRVVVRITPAQAGKSEIRPVSFHFHRDHPRAGGEKAAPRAQKCEEEGSPPHRRGKDEVEVLRWHCRGITPAQAGKRTRSWRAYGYPWDHPRVGGEKWLARKFCHAV